MNCLMEGREMADLVLAYCAGKLDSETSAVVERHLAGCPACREFQTGQQALWSALDNWEAMPVSDDFDRRLYRKIEAREAQASWWSRLVWPYEAIFSSRLFGKSVPLAAAAALLVLAGVILERPANVAVPEDVADVRIESIQPDQVERTLDDMELLRQFKITASSDSGNVNSM
jgi:anti-sigma factor RsiW